MTIMECYEQAVSLIPEKPEENIDMQRFAVVWCNILLAETLAYENIYRKANGMEELLRVPMLNEVDEEIPYNERLVRGAFPYGMARWIFRENDDAAASHEYYTLYTVALKEATPLLEGEINDVYG